MSPMSPRCALALLVLSLPAAAQATRIVVPGSAPPADRAPELSFLPASVLANGILEHGGDLAFLVSEAETGPGGTDFNGDGDTDDRILGLYTRSTQSFEITDMDARFLARGDGFLAVHRNELDSGTDFDGDGNLDDEVVFVRDLATGATTNLGVDLVSMYAAEGDLLAFRARTPFLRLMIYTHSTGTLVNTGFDTVDVALSREGVAFSLWESHAGDLNGDGDSSDFVAQVLLPDLTTRLNTGLVTTRFLGFVGARVVFRSREVALDRDLNGDGELDDEAVFVFDIPSATTRTAGVVSDVSFSEVTLAQGVAYFRQAEDFAGDLNGDGDVDDDVLVAHDVAAGQTAVSGRSARFADALGGRVLAFLVEEDAGQDANGDGDQIDAVPLVWDVAQGTTTNLGRAGLPSLVGAIGRRRVVYLASEFGEGIDRNGDGDVFDEYVESYDLAAGTTRDYDRPVGSDVLRSGDHRRGALFRVLESHSGDLNGDGDLHDAVMHVLDFEGDQVFDTGLAASFPAYVHRRGFAFLALESGVDLNGDGDGLDGVIALGRFR